LSICIYIQIYIHYTYINTNIQGSGLGGANMGSNSPNIYGSQDKYLMQQGGGGFGSGSNGKKKKIKYIFLFIHMFYSDIGEYIYI
jgi:hypothetical protein